MSALWTAPETLCRGHLPGRHGGTRRRRGRHEGTRRRPASRRRPVLLLLPVLLIAAGCSNEPVLENVDVDALRQVMEQIDGDRAMDTIADLVAAHQADTPLDCTSFESVAEYDCHLTHENARAMVQERLEALGLMVTTQDTADGETSTSNIVLELPGATHPEEIVQVSAHYDAFYAGADDNSSGTAAVLELARVLSGYTFARTIRFIGFDLEEWGLVGSTRYVDAGGGDDNIVAALNYDCIAYYDDTPGSQTGLPGLVMPTTGDFLGVVADEVSSARASELVALNDLLGVTKVAAVVAGGDGGYPLTGNLMRSDHAPFWLAEKPVVFLTDTANFRNPNYHTAADTIDTLNADFYTQVIQLSAVSLAYWAGGPQ